MRPLVWLSTLLLGALSPAQNACEGGSMGGVYLTTTVAPLGGNLVMHVGSPVAPNGLGLLVFGNGAGPTVPFCLDVSGLFLSMVAVLDGGGDAAFTLPIAAATPPGIAIFARAVVLESGGFGHSKTVRVATEIPDSTRLLANLAQARSLHTVTSFAASPRSDRTGALVAGGATGSPLEPVPLASTEVFDSLSRSWSPGPAMVVPRALHAAVLLADGRILVAGGMTAAPGTAFGGPATGLCEVYDPAGGTFAATGAMQQPRLGHGMSLLPDGRVLATGGFADWSAPSAGANFLTATNSTLASTEVWDPATGIWSLGPTMATARARHSHTALANGFVLLAGGVTGGNGAAPPYQYTLTANCELFDPATYTLAPTASLAVPRAFHGACLLANDDVLVSGGTVPTPLGAAATITCERFAVPTGTWTPAPSLPIANGIACHTATRGPSGDAVLLGGHVGRFQSIASFPDAWFGSTWWQLRHDGAAVTVGTPLGWLTMAPTGNPWSTGGHAAALLHDGTILVTGGYLGVPNLLGITLSTSGLVISP